MCDTKYCAAIAVAGYSTQFAQSVSYGTSHVDEIGVYVAVVVVLTCAGEATMVSAAWLYSDLCASACCFNAL
jgi:hypothetical protein